ncbi:insulinase family protein [Streptomyces sp. NPDC102282]|uniref:insulinase family protein n=1 Tax=Streptomyces sp. NPDC102282 TaxID=3366154 RepID=UPI0038144D7C
MLRIGGVQAVQVSGASHISLGLAIPAGFSSDPAGTPGVAHVCEHSVLAATQHSSRDAFPVAAITGCHNTTFSVDITPEDFDSALQAFAAIVRPDINRLRIAVAQERQVVSLELLMGAGAVGHGIGAAVADRLVPQSGLGHEVAATPGSVAHVSFPDVLACVQAAYQPQAAILVMAGAVTEGNLHQAAEFFPGGNRLAPCPTLAAGTANEPVPAWGIAYSRPPRGQRPQAAWLDCLDNVLIQPSFPTGQLARTMEGVALGSVRLCCPLGDLAVSAYRGSRNGLSGRAAAAGLRELMLSDGTFDKLVSTAVQSASRSYASRRSRLDLPWEIRDLLLDHVTGTGPAWELWEDPYDYSAATQAAVDALSNVNTWDIDERGRCELSDSSEPFPT